MKKAFTMLELIFVIVVVGIISVMIAPSFQRNTLQEAADQLVSHIRYTQHLAMMDNRFDTNNANWYKTRWQIVFSETDNYANNKPSYTIYRNLDSDTAVDRSEIARNISSPDRYMTGGVTGYVNLDIRNLSQFMGTNEMNLGEEFGITDISLSSSCSTGTKIAFDNIGRPIKGPLRTYSAPYVDNRMIKEACDINISTSSTEIITIRIEPETGYTHIL